MKYLSQFLFSVMEPVTFFSAKKAAQLGSTLLVLCLVVYSIHFYNFGPRNVYEFKSCLSNSSNNATYWNQTDFYQLNPKQLLEYFEWPNHGSCRLFHDFGGKMFERPTGLDGQKAICLDALVAPQTKNCLVYSFGINNEWSFDEAMESYGCQVFSFDPSMAVGDHDHRPNIHFFKLGLGGENKTNDKGFRLLPLSTIYENLKPRHGDRVIDYLKIDIDYEEWSVIPQIIQSGMLDKVRQLGMEVHVPFGANLEELRHQAETIRSIEKTGMIRFNSKPNPWSIGMFQSFHIHDVSCFEIAWYNNKFNSGQMKPAV